MTLVEAILAGILLRPKARGGYFTIEGACVLGAAYLGLGLPLPVTIGEYHAVLTVLAARFPELMRQQACPVCHAVKILGAVMIHLNDSHEWPREHIANWLVSLGE